MIQATAPKDMTAEQYKEYQGGITGYMQSIIYCRKIFNESNNRLKLLKRSYQEYLILLADEAVNEDTFGEYELDDDYSSEIETCSAM